MTDDRRPIICWVRRDLRLADNPVLCAAAATGRPVVPLFILDPETEALGAAAKYRLGLAIEAFAGALAGIGSRLILRRGAALESLRAAIAETGASAVVWGRLYDPASVARDTAVKAALKSDGIEARSVNAHLMFEPWEVETRTGGPYKVYTPYWNAVRDREVPAPLPAVTRLAAPGDWPVSEALGDWAMGAAMNRGADVVRPWLAVGEAAARNRLDAFIEERIRRYATDRDKPGVPGTSRLSENLAVGEISVRTCWHAALTERERGGGGTAGVETWMKELVWREFAYHLLHHTPRIASRNWREEWDAFPWNRDESRPEVLAWKQGRTGIRFVDAAMRELYVTGTMHNRARMIVASFLTKHLLTDWTVGLRWFEDCLVDWDPASNAMGWQWSAGSGPDAAPYFRVFNPVSQREKFDPDRSYVDRWIAEGRRRPADEALSYFEAIPRSWGLAASDAYPEPVVTPEAGRARALKAYAERGF